MFVSTKAGPSLQTRSEYRLIQSFTEDSEPILYERLSKFIEDGGDINKNFRDRRWWGDNTSSTLIEMAVSKFYLTAINLLLSRNHLNVDDSHFNQSLFRIFILSTTDRDSHLLLRILQSGKMPIEGADLLDTCNENRILLIAAGYKFDFLALRSPWCRHDRASQKNIEDLRRAIEEGPLINTIGRRIHRTRMLLFSNRAVEILCALQEMQLPVLILIQLLEYSLMPAYLMLKYHQKSEICSIVRFFGKAKKEAFI